MQRKLKLSALLQVDVGEVLLPVGSLSKVALLLQELDGALESSDGN